MTTFRFDRILLLLAGTACASSAIGQSAGWAFRDLSQQPSKSVEAVLFSRDGRAKLAINCSHFAEPTISIQYRPNPSVGLAMAPVVLDWASSRGAPLGAKLIWEPASTGAFARDGVDDSRASQVAEAIEKTPATLTIRAADNGGGAIETYYDSTSNLQAVGRVLAHCSLSPQSTH